MTAAATLSEVSEPDDRDAEVFRALATSSESPPSPRSLRVSTTALTTSSRVQEPPPLRREPRETIASRDEGAVAEEMAETPTVAVAADETSTTSERLVREDRFVRVRLVLVETLTQLPREEATSYPASQLWTAHFPPSHDTPETLGSWEQSTPEICSETERKGFALMQPPPNEINSS